MRRNCLIGIIFSVLILAGIASGVFFIHNDERNEDVNSPPDISLDSTGSFEDITPLDKMDLPDIVAVINGEKISKEKILQDYHQMKVLYESAGIDTSSPDVTTFMKEALISDTITTTLLAQEAVRRGIEVDEIRIIEEMDKNIARFSSEAEYRSMLEQLNMTEEAFREKLKRQLKIADVMKEWVDERIESSDDLEFTDEEKRNMYAIIDAKLGGMPSYEEIEDTMNEMLEYSKVQVILGDYIQNLIDESEIEVRIR